MKKTITIKNVTIGEGMPKICVPLTGSTLSELKEEALALKPLDFDVVEWRVDFFEGVSELPKVLDALEQIHAIIADSPLIFTFRTAKEGGQREISIENYLKLNLSIIQSGKADLIDVELFSGEENVKKLVEAAQEKGVFVILSNHDFIRTPTKEEIISRLCKAQELGADLPKIAVMPNKAADVLTLLDATNTMVDLYADRPIITMSMGDRGMISRLAGGIFGSALTFGSAKKASAPGQMPVAKLREIMDLLQFQ